VRLANDIGYLDFQPVSQSRSYDVFSDVTRHVRRRAVYLCRVFTGESAAAVPGNAAISIDDNLAPGAAGIRDRTADDKAPGGVNEVPRLLIQ
jgi:hypothetical protein